MSSSSTSSHAIRHPDVSNILVVEDDDVWIEKFRSDLEGVGYHLYVAKDGGQATSELTRHKPDFVLLDLMLPRESGFEICYRFKQRESSIPIVIVSAIDLDESKLLADRAGADGYLVKPWSKSDLLTEIYEITEQRDRERDSEPSTDRVRFSCRCGKRLKVSAQFAGRILSCPQCGETLRVPPANSG